MRKKQLVLSLLVIAMVFSLVYPSIVAAQTGIGPLDSVINWGLGKIGGGAKAVVGFTVGGVLRLFLEGAQGLLRGAGWFTEWVSSDPVGKTLSYTNPGNNLFIRVGWTLLRDLTNILFILGLAYIGLATALDWAGFDTKKTFGKLIIVALLINFSPVICGIFVDISHILKDFFLGSNLSFDSLNTSYQAIQDKIPWDRLDAKTIMQSVIAILFSFLAILILLAIGLYFLIRIVMIWLLVMISPLVFFSWIFDSTKRLWMFWKKQFTLWVFAIVPLSFFIYIATYIMANLDKFTTYEGDPTGGVFPTIFPQIAVLILLLVGFFLSFQIISLIATPIYRGAKKVVKTGAALGKGAYRVGKFGAKVAGGVGFLAASAAKGAVDQAGKTGKVRSFFSGAMKGVFTRQGRESTKQSMEDMSDKVPFTKKGWYSKRRRERTGVDDAKERMAGFDDEKLKSLLGSRTLSPGERTGIIEMLSERKKFAFKKQDGTIDTAKEKKLIEQAKALGVDLTELKKVRQDLIPIIDSEKLSKSVSEKIQKGMDKTEARKLAEREIIAEAVHKQGSKNFARDTQDEALKNINVFLGMDPAKVNDIVKNGSYNQKAAIKDHTQGSSMDYCNKLYREAHGRGDTIEMNRLTKLVSSVRNNPEL